MAEEHEKHPWATIKSFSAILGIVLGGLALISTYNIAGGIFVSAGSFEKHVREQAEFDAKQDAYITHSIQVTDDKMDELDNRIAELKAHSLVIREQYKNLSREIDRLERLRRRDHD